MNVRACVCIGVSVYSDNRLQPLPGAQVDAERVFEALVGPNDGQYDPKASCLLVNPTKKEVLDAIADVIYGTKIDTFTLFFAGHGGSISESYSLCCADTDKDRFAFTALSIGEVFALINDAKPIQSNIIVDACNAAGMLSDFGNLLKPSLLGQANSSSVSILAMSASDRSANETSSGGIGTTALLRCLTGETKVPVRKEYLSLEDIGAVIAPDMHQQTPNTWSFNVSGASRFAVNPNFNEENSASPYTMPSFGGSVTELLSKDNTETVWQEYVAVSDEIDPRRLQNKLQNLLRDVHDPDKQANLLLGLFESFSARANEADDAFAVVEVQSIFVFAAGGIVEGSVRRKLQKYLIAQLDHSLENAVNRCVVCATKEYGLVSREEAFSEFFALPVRISKIAAWCLCSVYLAAGDEKLRDRRIVTAREILDQLKANYEPSFSLVSEEQAPYIQAISELAPLYGLSKWSEEYISTLYCDYFFFGQRVAKTGIADEHVFDFLKYRTKRQPVDYRKFSAKPSELAFVLFNHFVSSEREDIIKYDLSELDKTSLSTFIPNSYSNFAEEVIESGTNVGLTVGFDVFTISDFKQFVSHHILPETTDALKGVSQQDREIALLASLIYPNRIAWFLSV